MVGALYDSSSNYATPKKEVIILAENCSRHSVCSNDERMEKALTMQQQQKPEQKRKKERTPSKLHIFAMPNG